MPQPNSPTERPYRRLIHYAPIRRDESYCGRVIWRAQGTPRTDAVECRDCLAALRANGETRNGH